MVVPTAQPTAALSGTSDPKAGEAIFTTSQGGQIACNICHNVAPGSGTLVGPSLDGIAIRAISTVPGESAEQYLRNSIVNPSAYVVPGFADGLMPQAFGTVLTQQQLDDLIAYLMTLK